MRKRGGNFLQKAMAVLLSAVLCVGLIVGSGPMDAQATEGTQTARLRVEVLGYDGTDTDILGEVLFTNDDESQQWPVSVSVEDGVITYEVIPRIAVFGLRIGMMF